jgi:methanogenic corrinoid protein MtbC1
MSQADRSTEIYSSVQTASLMSVVYRSRAVTALSDYELYELVQKAQARNESLHITGLLLYDNGHFYQWIEGPTANITQLMRDIAADNRHTDLEILSEKPCETRQFGDWRMRLATRGIRSIHSINNVFVPTVASLEHLDGSAGAVEEALAGMSGVEAEAEPANNAPLGGPAGAILKDILVSAVLPELLLKYSASAARNPWPIDQRARALADLLIGPNTEAALDLLRTLQDSDGAIRHLYETLLEPTARRLGDLWGQDLCAELDVTLGLAQLQRAVRVLNEEVMQPTTARGLYLPAVLIVPEPGEAHMLGAVLESEVLTAAGWDPITELPSSDEALQDMIADSWFDALDLSLSASVRRETWMPKVRQTIALARHASRNPALVVVVGGRIFAEEAGAGQAVGADAQMRSARHSAQTIRDGMEAKANRALLDRMSGD